MIETETTAASDKGAIRKGLAEVMWVAAPKVSAGLALLTLNLVLLRSWGPEQFGLISVCLTAIVLLDTIFGSAIDMSLFRLAPLARERHPQEARQLEQAGLLLKPAAALIFLPLLWLLAPRLSGLLFQRTDQGGLIVLSYLALVGILLVRSSQVHFQIERTFRRYGLTDLAHSALRFGVSGLLIWTGVATPVSVLGAMAAGSFLVAALTLATFARPVLIAKFSLPAVGQLLATVKWYLATVVVGSVIGRMDVFWVSALAGVEEAGVYGAAQLFALLPQLVGIYLAAVFSPRVLPMWQKGELQPIYSAFQRGLTAAAFGIFLCAAIALSTIGAWLLPPAYREAAPVILLLLPAGLAAFVAFPWAIPFLLFARPKLLLTVDCLALPLLALAYYLTIPRFGIRGAAIVTSGFGLARTAFFLVLANRILKSDPRGHTTVRGTGFGPALQLAGSST